MTSFSVTLADLGWSAHFDSQPEPEETGALHPVRIAQVHRDRVDAVGEAGWCLLSLGGGFRAGDIAVGDWVLTDPRTGRIRRILDRRTCLARKAAGDGDKRQLIAANVNTLFITTSCNDDFNPARLERYIALALEAETLPVILLTKPDICEDAADYLARARRISDRAKALPVNARGPDVPHHLSPWCGKGQTVALLGSSGVGKSTIAAALTSENLATAAIREDDSRGRHTTTARSMYRIPGGGWLIDTPGMRELALKDAADGIDALFEDIVGLSDACRFRDCAHDTEPGCAVQEATGDGRLTADRLERWKKLRREDARNSETQAGARRRDKSLGRLIRGAQGAKHRRRDT